MPTFLPECRARRISNEHHRMHSRCEMKPRTRSPPDGGFISTPTSTPPRETTRISWRLSRTSSRTSPPRRFSLRTRTIKSAKRTRADQVIGDGGSGTFRFSMQRARCLAMVPGSEPSNGSGRRTFTSRVGQNPFHPCTPDHDGSRVYGRTGEGFPQVSSNRKEGAV